MKKSKLNLLVAYPYASKQTIELLHAFDKECPNQMRFFLDSGAFTAHSSGKTIEIDDYCRFVEQLPFKPWRYFALDVIGDEEATVKNYEIMLDRGFDPVPVFTYGQSLDDIDYYFSKTDYIAYGGIVGKPSSVIAQGVKAFQERVAGRKSHLLGYTSMPYIKHFKPYSCDSSSWEGGARFGGADIYLGNGKMKKLKKDSFMVRPPDNIIAAVKELGLDPYAARKADQWCGGDSFLRKVGAASWVKMGMDCERNINTKLFLAFATALSGSYLIEAYRRIANV